MAADNRTLARFDLIGIPPAPRGVAQIEVTFDIDANGIVHVSAKDLGTGKEQNIEVKVSSGLSQEEIDDMLKVAEEQALTDAEKKDSVRTRNEAEILSYSTEQTLKEHGDRIPEQDKEKIELSLAELKELLKKSDSDPDEIRKLSQNLSTAVYKIAEMMYHSSSAEESVAGDGS